MNRGPFYIHQDIMSLLSRLSGLALGIAVLGMAYPARLEAQGHSEYSVHVLAAAPAVYQSGPSDGAYVRGSGLGVGVGAVRPLASLLSLEGQLGYRINRYRQLLHSSERYGVYTASGWWHAVELPVLLNIHAPFDRSLTVEVGPVVDVMLRQHGDVDVEYPERPQLRVQGTPQGRSPAAPHLSVTWGGLGEMQRFVLGGAAGASYRLENAIGWPVELGVRYGFDLTASWLIFEKAARKRLLEGALRLYF
jgi:hypothetical protein